MKKHLFTLLFAVFSAVSLLAVPAHRQWRTVIQADGSVIEVMTVGDEFYHYTVNREGQQVRETNGVYQVVGEAPTAEVANARRAKAMTRRQRKDIGTTPNLAPKGVVILANFSDQSMQSGHTQATFDELYNSTNCTVNGGYPSAAQYFADQSNGAYRPQFDVYGPVTLSRSVSYYGADKDTGNSAVDEGDDQHATDAVVEACILANQQYTINWADYDSNNDGYIDFVYVIYAGRGEADGGASTTIWPHAWQVSLARTSGNCTYTAADCKVGGKVIEYYAMSSELSVNSLCGIGTFCYEFGHINGLPYLYDTNYGTNYTKCLTPNDWNIMDGGAYNGEGHCPPNYDPWQKDFFGWHTPVNLGSEAQNVTLYANGTENYQAYQINASGSYVGPTDSGVRYYIENRQATGWDAPLTGHGMLVWQVNFNTSKWANNEVNNTANDPYYTIVSASGTKIGLDSGGGTNYSPMNTFPGKKNVTTCTPISDRELTEITETSNVITCKFNGGTSGATSTTDGDIPSDAVLAQYYGSGQVCVCIYVPVEIACNDMVLVGSFNGWNATVSECPLFRPVAGYDGWYVTSFIPEDQPDATKGIQAKPVILDADGRFSWDYQVGAATVVRGDVMVVQGAYASELDLINYGTGAPNVLTIEAWKSNPCTAVYHNYTITVVNEGCDGLAVPFITGSMTNWSFTQMEKNTNLWQYGIPAYSYSFKAPEGSSYQLLNGLADTTGTIIEAPDWSNEASYLQKYVDGEWVRMPGDEGTNLLTKEDEDIVYDLRDTTVYRWARCAPSEEQNPESDYQDYTILLYDPVCEDNPEFSPALFLNGDFVGFEKTLYGDREVWYARVEAIPGTSCHIVELNNTFGNEIQQFDSTTQQWWGMMPSTFPYGTSADGTTLLYDYSNTELYRYALCGKLGYDDSTLVNMTVKFKAPSGAPEKVALVGNFVSNNGNSWVDGVLMTYKNGFYTATVKATMNSQFKFKEYADDSNYIYYTNGSSLENFVFGEFMDDLGTVTVDLSDDSRYKWKVWSDYKPIEIYSITVQADNTENGTVRGGGEYKEGETAVIMATPRKDCTFAGWNDGNTLNPRAVVVTGDSAFTAIFRRNIPLPVVVCSDTMYFTSADSIMIATRVYAPSQIEDYDQLIIATVNNKNVMGFQFVEDAELRNFRTAVEYTKNMPITNVSVVEVVPNGGNYRLRVADGELAPRCEDCTSATNQLYATQVGADWYFAQYDNSILPEAAAYANRMILYNEEAPRFSSYRQVTGLNRSQTTVFKLHTPRNIPQIPEEIPEDTVSMVEEEKPMEDIPVNIEPKDTVAVISTPYVEYVHSFTLIVWADEAQTQVLVMITYDSEGNQLSITRPSAIRRLPAVNTDITFEINELKPSKTYHYTLIACEDDGSILTSLNSSFETATTASGIQDLSADPSQPLKILLDGQILILRAGKLYTLTGQEVK